ncbi:MAG: FimV/HubP family polar landmark protein, partial [Lysobacter sp.]
RDVPPPASRPNASKAAKPVAPAVEPVDDAAIFDRRERQPLPHGRPEAPAPAWHNGASKAKPVVTPVAVSAAETSVGERLELAQAYLDLGDRESARQLLSEVAANGDQAARQQASRMLRELE